LLKVKSTETSHQVVTNIHTHTHTQNQLTQNLHIQNPQNHQVENNQRIKIKKIVMMVVMMEVMVENLMYWLKLSLDFEKRSRPT